MFRTALRGGFAVFVGLAGLALLATTASARPKLAPGNEVAVLELEAPRTTTFTLHGTIPLPKGVFPRADGQIPFAVEDWNGTLVPAQMEVVSWYPDMNDGADVAEIIARVHLAPGTLPDARVRYDIVSLLHAPAGFTKTPAVQSLFAAPNKIVLRARDCFGHLYQSDLLQGPDGVKQRRQGAFQETKRNYQVMRPVSASIGPPSGALVRLFGVHAYVSTWANEDLVGIDLRLHNGTSGADSQSTIDDPQADLYFESVELVVPNGWLVMPDLRDVGFNGVYVEGSNSVFPLVERRSDGKLHLFPQQAQTLRRLMIAKTTAVQSGYATVLSETLGFCQPGSNSSNQKYYSWWNPQTARFFPQRHRLPELDHIGKNAVLGRMSADFDNLAEWVESGVKKGAYPFFNDQLGWAFPYGNYYGGWTGGTEVFLYDGVSTAWSGSDEGYRMYQLLHRTYMDRHPISLFDKDGEPTSIDSWIIHGPQFDYVDMQFYLTLLQGNDPFGMGTAPSFQVNFVQQSGLEPPYAAALRSYNPIDIQHQVRYLRSPKVLAWLGNDQLAKDDLVHEASILWLSYHELPNAASGQGMGSGMLSDINFTENNPGVGFSFGRGEAWTIDGMCAAYSVASASWRTRAYPWFDTLSSVLRHGQADCSGFIQAVNSSKDFNGQYRVRRSTETAMIENSIRSMVETVFRGADPKNQGILEFVLSKSTRAMVGAPSWLNSSHGPTATLAVGPLAISQPPYCGSAPSDGISNSPDKFQTWSSFAYGWELTQDQLFMDKSLEMIGGSDLLAALKSAKYTNLENRAALLALALELYGP